MNDKIATIYYMRFIDSDIVGNKRLYMKGDLVIMIECEALDVGCMAEVAQINIKTGSYLFSAGIIASIEKDIMGIWDNISGVMEEVEI